MKILHKLSLHSLAQFNPSLVKNQTILGEKREKSKEKTKIMKILPTF